MGEWESLTGILGLAFERLSRYGLSVFNLMHCTIGAGAIVAGSYLLQSSFGGPST